MISQLLDSKKVIYALMTLLVFMWGMEYIAAKSALDAVKPLSLICIKYCVGLVFLMIIKMIVDRRFPLKVRDICAPARRGPPAPGHRRPVWLENPAHP